MQRPYRCLYRSFSLWQQPQQPQRSFTEKLSLLSMEGHLDEAIRILQHPPDQTLLPLNSEAYLPLIRSCIKFKACAQGRKIHKLIIESGIKPDVILYNNIMMMYSKCGDFELTHKVFDEMTERNLFSWTAIIGAYSNCGNAFKAFEMYENMILEGIRADHFLYPLVLKSCAGMKVLRKGKRVHADVIRSGFQWDTVVMNSLIDMYTKCENVGDAEKAFDETVIRDIFTWTTMLVGYAQMDHGLEALEVFKEMMLSGVKPSSATLAGILPLFSNLGFLRLAKQIHGLTIVSGNQYDKFVGTALVDMYANCRGLGYGRLIFDRVKEKDVVCWNAMIKGYAQMDLFDEASELLKKMEMEGVKPNKTTWDCFVPQYVQGRLSIQSFLDLINRLEHAGVRTSEVFVTSLQKINDHIEDRKEVKELHRFSSSNGYISDSAVASTIISMYSKFGDIKVAQEIFDCFGRKDLDCWNSMIACYAYNNNVSKALELFDSMKKMGIKPNLLSWNTIISGLVNTGDFDLSLKMFSEMKWTNQKPNSTTFDIILPVIGNLNCSRIGKQLHSMFLRHECEMNRFISTAFINMYSNCQNVTYAVMLFDLIDDKDLVSWNAIISGLTKNGFLNEASRTFHEMKMAGIQGNIITWTTLISGYAKNGQVDESLRCFRELQLEGLKPNSITITSILPACAYSAISSHGKSIHGYIVKSETDCNDLFVTNGLIDMFVKCGYMEYAERVFRRLPQKDVVSWNTMIQGFAVHGKPEAGLGFFHQMLAEGVVPDSVTFIGVLSACSHAGLVDEGWKQFNSMQSMHGILPSGKHYACMVDLLGRKGLFEDVKIFILQMPLQPTASLWGALLSSCKTHGNVEMAEYAVEHLLELQPENPGNYVVLSNIYASVGRWNDVDRVRKMMVDRGVKKLPACSWIEVGNSIYAFTVENLSKQDMNEEMSKLLLDLAAVMVEEGYVPEINTTDFI